MLSRQERDRSEQLQTELRALQRSIPMLEVAVGEATAEAEQLEARASAAQAEFEAVATQNADLKGSLASMTQELAATSPEPLEKPATAGPGGKATVVGLVIVAAMVARGCFG